MKRSTAPVRMLHHLAVLDRLLRFGAQAGPQGCRQRRQLQRQGWLRQVLSDHLPLEPNGSDRFWVVLRWGGCGLLTAEALHHLLPG
jgi:hypothetical protein